MKYGVLMYSDPAETKAMPVADRDMVGSMLDFHVTAVEVRQVHDSVDAQELTRGK
jgi:hypothetical protein